MALYAQYAQRIANTTPHAKSGINRLDIAFIEKTKAENAKIKKQMLNNTFVKKNYNTHTNSIPLYIAENAIIKKTPINIAPNIFFEILLDSKKSSITSRTPIATM